MKALEEYLRLTGLSQAELAKRLKVRPEDLNRWLNDHRAPTVANLKKISAHTGISLEKLAAEL
jgi:transcriptional regulator with XRE-family HTH domain